MLKNDSHPLIYAKNVCTFWRDFPLILVFGKYFLNALNMLLLISFKSCHDILCYTVFTLLHDFHLSDKT